MSKLNKSILLINHYSFDYFDLYVSISKKNKNPIQRKHMVHFLFLSKEKKI